MSGTNIASNVFWSYAERMSAQIVGLLVSIVLARLLEPSDYGTVALIMVFITICDAIIDGGFSNALIQKKNATIDDFNSVFCLSICISVLLYAVIYFLAPYIGFWFSDDLLIDTIRVLGFKLFFSGMYSTQQAYVQKKLLFKKAFVATSMGIILSAFIGIYMAFNGFGVWSLIAQNISNIIINIIIFLLVLEWKPKVTFNKENLLDLWSYGSKVFAATFVYTFKDNIRSVLIGSKFTPSDLAFYNQGMKFPTVLVSNIVDAIGKVLFPVLSQQQDDLYKLKDTARKAVAISCYILSPMIIGLMVVSDEFVVLTLTEKWLPCVVYIQILCINYITRSLNAIFQKCLFAIGRSDVNLLHETVTTVVTIILLLVAILYFDSAEFIAWSYVCVMLLGTGIFAYYVHKYIEYKYSEMVSDFGLSTGLAVFVGMIVLLVNWLPLESVLVILLIKISIGLILYGIISYILKIDAACMLLDIVKERFKIGMNR